MDPRVAHIDQLAFVRESQVVGGPAHGCRAIDVAPLAGLEIRVLPDRGLDIGSARFAGIGLSWTSAVGETAPHDLIGPESILDYFGGGLLTTCGLRNVGAPSEGHGLHGAFSHQRATNVSVSREELADGNVAVEIRGCVTEASALGHRLLLERRIRVQSGRGLLEIWDRTTNLGVSTEAAPILYHLNFGYPFLDNGTRFKIPSRETLPLDPTSADFGDQWRAPGGPQPGFEPVVVEHVDIARDGHDVQMRIVNPQRAVEVELSWSAATLPRLHQWLHLRPHVYVVAIEPSNCSVQGRSADREQGLLPVLEPGESRVTSVCLAARSLVGVAPLPGQ